MTLRIGSLFSGYGGTDIAVINALGDGHVVWHSDTKPAAIALLKHRYPGVPNLGDITQIDWSLAAPIDAIAVSWPCQPHSAAGKRLGEKDPRALWPHVARALHALRPAIFFGENVGRITSNGELRRVVRSLAELGYVGAWRCVRASDIGACHRRDRAFIVAIDPSSPRVGDGELWNRCDWPSVRATGHRNLRGTAQGLVLLPTPRESDGVKGGPGMRGSSGDRMLPSAVIQLLPTPTARDASRGRGWTGQPGRPLSETIMRIDGWKWGRYSAAINRHRNVLDRAVPKPTQISSRTGNPQLAPKFVEWMMMVPENHVTGVPGTTRNQQLSLLGDGVVPSQGVYAFTSLLIHLIPRLGVNAA